MPGAGKATGAVLFGLVLGLVLESVLGRLFGVPLARVWGLAAAPFLDGGVHRLALHPLVPGGLSWTVLHCLVLWFVGGRLERSWGLRRYASFLAACAAGGGLAFVLGASLAGAPAFPMAGAGSLCAPVLAAFGLLRPRHVFVVLRSFPMRAGVLCSVLVGIEAVHALLSPGAVLVWGLLGSLASGALAALLFARRRLSPPRFTGGLSGRRPGGRPGERPPGDPPPPRYFQ